MQQEREQMKEELLTLQQKISKQINTISDLEQAHDKVNQEMEQMTLLLAAREADIVNLQSKKEEGFHHVQQQLCKELTETKLENDKLREQIKQLMISRQKVLTDNETQTITGIGEMAATSEDLLTKLKVEYAASETDLQSQVLKKEETINSLREQVQQLTEMMAEHSQCQNCSHLKKQVEDFKLKFEPLETRAVTMEKENKELTEQIKRLQEDSVAKSDAAISEKSQLQSELAKCSKELERLKTHLLQVLFTGGENVEKLFCHFRWNRRTVKRSLDFRKGKIV